MKKWVLYIAVLGFSSYWASNLLLWFPWSYSAMLGMTLMLTVAPLIWAYATFLGLKSYPGPQLLKPALLIALVFLLLSAVMDYIFFGLIRNAMDELYHPTTFYGYGFLLVWPILLAFLLKRKLSVKTHLSPKHFLQAGIAGMACFFVLVLIIILGIEI